MDKLLWQIKSPVSKKPIRHGQLGGISYLFKPVLQIRQFSGVP